MRSPPVVPPHWKVRLFGLGMAAAAASVVILAAPAWLAGAARAVAAYDAGAASLLLFFWTLGMHHDHEKTAARAASDDPGRNVVLGVVLASAAAGLVSAISILGHGPHVPTVNEKYLSYILGITAVVLGWFLIHTVFVFRYAHMYYYDDDDDSESDRGLTFPGTPTPNDFDFAYFSFVVGMTFQVSDVQVTDPGVRRVVLFHGLASFAYNTAILALGINIISGLLH